MCIRDRIVPSHRPVWVQSNWAMGRLAIVCTDQGRARRRRQAQQHPTTASHSKKRKENRRQRPPAPAVAKGRANSPPPPRADSRERNRHLGGQSTSSAQTYGHNRTTTGRPGKSISFGKHPRIVHLSSIACECHDSDPDSVYRKCCVSVGTNQTTYYYVCLLYTSPSPRDS